MWPFKKKVIVRTPKIDATALMLVDLLDNDLTSKSKNVFHDNVQLIVLSVPITVMNGRQSTAAKYLLKQVPETDFTYMARSVAVVNAATDLLFITSFRVEEKQHTGLELTLFSHVLAETNAMRVTPTTVQSTD